MGLLTLGGLAGKIKGAAAGAAGSIKSAGGIGAAAKAGIAGLPIYGVASGLGAALGATRGYFKARREAKKEGIDRHKNKDEWRSLRNKRMRNNAAAGAAIGLGAGLATGLMSDMITFDSETRQFGLKDIQYGTVGAIGGLGNTLYRSRLKRRYIQQLEEQGMHPNRARRMAEDKFGSTSGNFVKGAMGASGALWGVRKLNKLGEQVSK